MTEWQYRDFSSMFKYLEEHGMIAPEGDLEHQQVLLGDPSRVPHECGLYGSA